MAFNKKEKERGQVFWELMAWVGLFVGGCLVCQIQVSVYWRKALSELQTKRLPYTGKKP